MKRELFILVNPSSAARRGLDRWLRFQARLEAAGVAYDFGMFDDPERVRAAVPDLVSRYSTLVAAGGDGTLSVVADAVLATGGLGERVRLGVIPLGTGNDVAEALGIRDASTAVQALVRGGEQRWDALRVESRTGGATRSTHALAFVAVGIAADLLRAVTPVVKRWVGRRWAYPAGFVPAWLKHATPEVRVSVDGLESTERIVLLYAANARASGGGAIRVVPWADPGDGKVELCTVAAGSRWRTIELFRRLLSGSHTEHPAVRVRSFRRLGVDGVEPLDVVADGEFIGRTPAEIRLVPGAIRLMTAGAAGGG